MESSEAAGRASEGVKMIRGSWEGLGGSFDGSTYGKGRVGGKDFFFFFNLEVLIMSLYGM